MYNRYLTTAPDPPEPVHTPRQAAESSGLLTSLGQKLGGLKLDADTLITLAVIWFVLQDDSQDGIEPELLLAIGVLLVLGL